MTITREPTLEPPSVSLLAPAKINLTLAVLGMRPDGFHEIESLVTPIGLNDEIALHPSPDGRIVLECDDASLPGGPDNLAWKAADQIRKRTGDERGVVIRLIKRIPAGAGLGGGSSDAATVLVGLNRIWNLGLSECELGEVGSTLGSDVPLFIESRSAIIRGRGERVEPVDLGWLGWVVLVIPPFGLSTAEVYKHWRGNGHSCPGAMDVVQAVRTGDELGPLLYNMLESPAFDLEPRLRRLHADLGDLGVKYVRMSGSGSTLFALFTERDRADEFAAAVTRQLRMRAMVVRAPKCEQP